ncbi:hypothetical protein CBOM_07896 [Ceraceosorus bombacis]|uniref:Uncharacterized protein n=1 Tax=Ceraceosorus bombacis TaxID=401625 RepID=A0A0P1BR27_9BASI|nr:hypothetical protein CBOM_07896 [Ceraceosorus bombacis]
MNFGVGVRLDGKKRDSARTIRKTTMMLQGSFFFFKMGRQARSAIDKKQARRLLGADVQTTQGAHTLRSELSNQSNRQ